MSRGSGGGLKPPSTASTRARVTVATLDAHFGTDPSIAVAISELKQLGYVSVPDAGTVELTDVGFDAIHRDTA